MHGDNNGARRSRLLSANGYMDAVYSSDERHLTSDLLASNIIQSSESYFDYLWSPIKNVAGGINLCSVSASIASTWRD